MPLLEEREAYKPFEYPWAFAAFQKQQLMHWIPEEVPMGDDVRDWHHKLTEPEKHLITQIFRFFTQADIEVADCYSGTYSNIFKPVEIKMMLNAFLNMEGVHTAAYSHLLDTIGMPEIEYQAFLNYEEMVSKCKYLKKYKYDGEELSVEDIARTLAVFGAFTEGLQLFGSFAMLMNFQRSLTLPNGSHKEGTMKGMGQIVAWSIKDEKLHVANIIRLYHTFLQEHPEIDKEELNKDIYTICYDMVEHEIAFIDLAFEMGDIQGLSRDELVDYILYTAELRLYQLKIKDEPTRPNPLPWMDELMGKPHVNFFEQRVTEYVKSATKGTWDEVFAKMDKE